MCMNSYTNAVVNYRSLINKTACKIEIVHLSAKRLDLRMMNNLATRSGTWNSLIQELKCENLCD